MSVSPQVSAPPPAFTATLRLSPDDLRGLVRGVGVAVVFACVITGALSLDDALAMLQVFRH